MLSDLGVEGDMEVEVEEELEEELEVEEELGLPSGKGATYNQTSCEETVHIPESGTPTIRDMPD